MESRENASINAARVPGCDDLPDVSGLPPTMNLLAVRAVKLLATSRLLLDVSAPHIHAREARARRTSSQIQLPLCERIQVFLLLCHSAQSTRPISLPPRSPGPIKSILYFSSSTTEMLHLAINYKHPHHSRLIVGFLYFSPRQSQRR
jgi:hypothetical protein